MSESYENFDFEEWAKLAKEDPEGFEKLREQTLKELIESAPEAMQQRLHGLQWQLDIVRRKSGSPMASCLELSKMMWDNLLGDEGLLKAMRSLGETTPPAPPRNPADVLPFKPKPPTESS